MTDGASIIYLARHGETEWNRIGRWQGATDIPLSETGRAQARTLAAKLGDRGITRVHASHLSRARETAQIVAAHLGLPEPRTDARLRERGYGVFEGLTREECEARFPAAWERYLADRRAIPPEGEPHGQILARLREALHEIAAAAGDGPSLVISHGGCIRTFISGVLGLFPPPLENGAVFRVRFEGGAFVDAEREPT
jgi:broad specificity phosphatase PhoE